MFFNSDRDVGCMIGDLKIIILCVVSIMVLVALWYLAGSADKDKVKEEDDDFQGFGL